MPVASPAYMERLMPFNTWTDEAPSPSVSDTSFSSMTASVKADSSYMGKVF
jgi:hypothetical protein